MSPRPGMPIIQMRPPSTAACIRFASAATGASTNARIARTAAVGQRHQRLVGRAAPHVTLRQAVRIGFGNDRVEQRQRRRVLALQRRQRVAAVAEDVEVEVRRLPPRAQSREQRAQAVRLLERLAAADRHAVERVAGDAACTTRRGRARRSSSPGPAATCPATRSPCSRSCSPAPTGRCAGPGPSTVTGQCALLSCSVAGFANPAPLTPAPPVRVRPSNATNGAGPTA